MCKRLAETGFDRLQISDLIDRWIFSERDRKLVKRRILDGIRYEDLAEEFVLSVRQAKKIVYKCEERMLAKMEPWVL